MNRNEAREQAFVLLFGAAFSEAFDVKEILENAVQAREYEEDAYTLRLINGVAENRERIDSMICSKLNKWKLERLPKTTITILRLAVYEIAYCDDIPASVSINEAVELAKRFGSEKDYVFINGVLGSIAGSLE